MHSTENRFVTVPESILFLRRVRAAFGHSTDWGNIQGGGWKCLGILNAILGHSYHSDQSNSFMRNE